MRAGAPRAHGRRSRRRRRGTRSPSPVAGARPDPTTDDRTPRARRQRPPDLREPPQRGRADHRRAPSRPGHEPQGREPSGQVVLAGKGHEAAVVRIHEHRNPLALAPVVGVVDGDRREAARTMRDELDPGRSAVALAVSVHGEDLAPVPVEVELSVAVHPVQSRGDDDHGEDDEQTDRQQECGSDALTPQPRPDARRVERVDLVDLRRGQSHRPVSRASSSSRA